MGMWDEFCVVCGGPSAVFLIEGMPLPKAEDYTWLKAWVGISHTEEVIALDEDTGYGSFDLHPDEKKKNVYKSFDIGDGYLEYREADEAHGYACHVTCYSLLQRELNYTLRYQDVRPLLADAEPCALNKFAWSDYGGLSKYQDQGLCEGMLVQDDNVWMIEDPAVNAANAQRILALWRPLVHSGFQRPDSGDGSQRDTGDVAAAAPAGDRPRESVGVENAAGITDVQGEAGELAGLTLKSEEKSNQQPDFQENL